MKKEKKQPTKKKTKKKKKEAFGLYQYLRNNSAFNRFPGQFIIIGIILIGLWMIIENPIDKLFLYLGIISFIIEAFLFTKKIFKK